MKKVPVREQAPDVRNKNFDEVCLGYNKEEAMEGQERIMLSQRSQQRRKARKSLLSVQVLQDLHVPETLQKWDMT